MRTGTRCTTLTQLPLAFCGGRIANCAPVPGLTDATVPWKMRSGKVSTEIVDRLADLQIGDVGFLRIGVDPGRASSITANTGVPAVTKRPSWMLSTCVAMPSIGARSTVWSRSRCAWSSAALACM